uniref:Uncharacterized protein n=1 Tax=Arundo donax TaxID=35708 RepID=A0A0A9GH54_ARUDO
MKFYIWVHRASEFNIDVVCAMGHEEPVVVIFVGMQMKSFKGEHSLSANTACRWYINPEVPEVHDVLVRLHNDFQSIR